MKSSKRRTGKALCPEQEQEQGCGVWLDADELKAKKQRKLARPISKLLNPLARSGGYSVAVALNFTQTKMEMPATKQSTISSFFLPQSKKGKDADDRSSSWPSGMSSTPLAEAQTGTKRKREMISESPSERDDVSERSCLMDPQERGADIERVSAEACNDDDDDEEENKEQQFLHLIWGYQSEECEPAGKRRPPQNIQIEKTQRYSHETFQIHRSICGENGNGSSASLSSEDVYTQEQLKDRSVTEENASFLTPRSGTEIRNTLKGLARSAKEPELSERRRLWSPVKREDKENSRPTSPRHSDALSAFKQRVCSSPARRSSDWNRKLYRTPKKSIGAAQENDEDSFGTLFTQDSEGFRVIAHRGKRSRCPLKDQTNSREGRQYLSIPSVRPVETEENSDPEPEMLFTQDSQGNTVIKH